MAAGTDVGSLGCPGTIHCHETDQTGRLQPGFHRLQLLVGANRVGGIAANETFTAGASVTFTNLNLAPGVVQDDPILPTALPPQPGVPEGAQGGQFTAGPGARWFDPPLAQGYTFTATGAGLFRQIMAFPQGIPATYSITTEGQTYRPYTPEDFVDFEALRGHGVSSFVVKGIKPFVDATSLVAFPIMLDFTTPTLDFTMVPIAAPDLQMTRLSNGDVQFTFDGVLQSSPDLKDWTDVTPAPTSPHVIPKAQLNGAKFFRSRDP